MCCLNFNKNIKCLFYIYVSECSDNLNISHNSSSSTSTSLYFNQSTSLAFQCLFQISYVVPVTYTWYINDVNVNPVSSSLERYFTEGHYTVSCESSYQMSAHCEPCKKTASLSVTIDGMSLCS